jgi:cystathionine beta-synthase
VRRVEYCENILEAIGKTPLVKLTKSVRGCKPLMLAKLESMNPGGSVKDRIGLPMVEAAERAGQLKPGGTIVEGTSGNTGVGLAMVAAVKGYRAVFTMPDKMSAEKIRLLRAYGADVIVTPTAVPPDHPSSYYSVARRIQQTTPNCIYPNQYDNQANPEAHYRTTGPEIWKQTAGKVDVFVCGVGTGGTISGVGKFLKEQKPSVKVVGVDPEGSILKDFFDSGGTKVGTTLRTYKVEGIGEDIVPKALWWKHIDAVVRVDDKESFLHARKLAREEGILCGGSAGSALAGAVKYVKQERVGEDKVVVVLLPDSGERYLSKFYDDNWMRENRFLGEELTVGAILQRKTGGTPAVVSIRPLDKVRDAIELMNRTGITQLPVIDDKGQAVGSVEEGPLTRQALEDRLVLDYPVGKHMGPPFPSIDAEQPVMAAVDLLRKSAAVLVTRHGKLEGVLSRVDALEHMAP